MSAARTSAIALAAGLAGAALALVIGNATGVVDGTTTVREAPLAADPVVIPVSDRAPGGLDASAVYAARSPGVVSVELRHPGGPQGIGSGFVVDADEGLVVTAAHVVTNAAEVDDPAAVEAYDDLLVETIGGERADAKVVGFDLFSDVALLRVEPGDLPLVALPFTTTRDLRVGDAVAAIGSPFGRAGTLSVGVVSQLGRSIDAPAGVCFDTTGAIQADVALNPGNSGGPLLDARGRVIGVNVQVNVGDDGASAGIGYAVPSDRVQRSIDQLERTGRVRYAWLGIGLRQVDRSLARRFSLPARQGLLVTGVVPGSPAETAGLRAGDGVTVAGEQVFPEGDLIVRVDDTPVVRVDDLQVALLAHLPGEKAALTLFRDGKQRQVEVALAERGPETACG